MCIEHYEALTAARTGELDESAREFDDMLLKMQTEEGRFLVLDGPRATISFDPGVPPS